MTPDHHFTDKRRSVQSHKSTVKAGSKRAASGEQAARHHDDADPQVAENSDATEQPATSADGERYLRLAADFENYRRRTAQQILDQQRYASEAAARALLPVLDNLERALEHAPDDEESQGFVKGVQMAVRDFIDTLDDLGIRPIDAVGAPFDPALHEAIGGEESEDVDVETVTAELQRGWTLHDKVLRPSIVRISTPAATAE